MRREIKETLEKLVTSHNSVGRPIITGFNYYSTCLEVDLAIVISLSNIHSSQDYWRSVMEDLGRMGYPNESVSISTRSKKGFFQWRPSFFIRDERGSLEANLRIKNIDTGEYLDLEGISYRTLKEAGYSEAVKLIAENEGYEINTLTSIEEDLRRLAAEFLRKSSDTLFNEDGEQVVETEGERQERAPWPGASNVPVLIVSGNVSRFVDLPGFQKVDLFRFQNEEIGEYLFVMHKQTELLRRSEEYNPLRGFGFREEVCLANSCFIKEYVDDI